MYLLLTCNPFNFYLNLQAPIKFTLFSGKKIHPIILQLMRQLNLFIQVFYFTHFYDLSIVKQKQNAELSKCLAKGKEQKHPKVFSI